MKQFIRDGFTITLNLLDEDISFDDAFEGDDVQFIRDGVESGALLWFCAEVHASRNGHILGSAYLGACCYENEHDFVKNSGYFDGMVDEAIEEAKRELSAMQSPDEGCN